MKRRFFTILLTALLLTGCGAEDITGTEPEDTPTTAEIGAEEEWSETLQLTTEWEEYDPSVETIWFMLENQSEAEREIGVDYQLHRLSEDGELWTEIPFKEDVGWDAIALVMEDGGRVALACNLSAFDCDFSGGGTYRIVKAIDGEYCAGEFKLVEGAAISAETPYGYGPLEELPLDYSPIRVMKDGMTEIDLEAGVIFTGEGSYCEERVEYFLEKVRLDIPCQLRTIQDYGEGAVMVIDVIYENDHFLWRMWSGGDVVEQRFSYIVTDEAALYLSNGTDWESTLLYDSAKAFLVPEGQCQDLIPAVEQEMNNRLNWNITRYKIWSSDGVWSAGLSDSSLGSPTEFFITWQKQGEGSRGSTYDLQSWDGLETAVTAMEWQEDGILQLTCEQVEGGVSVLRFDPETEKLTNGL